MTFDIVDLAPHDRDRVRQVVEIVQTVFPDWLETEDAIRAEVGESFEPGRISLVAVDGDHVLGWIGAIPTYSHAWELHPLAVRPAAQRHGVGRALVTALEARVHERGALTVYLGTDDDGPTPGTSAAGIDLWPDPLAHASALTVFDHPTGFYRKLGYAVVGLIPDADGPGKPDVLMAKRLTP